MKKSVAVFMAILLILSLAGCSGGEIVHKPRDTDSQVSSTPYRQFKTGTDAMPSEADTSSDPDAVETDGTYWEKEPLFTFGLEQVPMPSYIKFYESFSSEDTMNVSWTNKKGSKSATRLAGDVFKALKDKNITLYEYKDNLKGEEIDSVDKAASLLSDVNARYEMVYRYNDTDYLLSISAVQGSGLEKKHDFVYMTLVMYFDNTHADDENTIAG